MFGPARSSRIDARAGIHRGNFGGGAHSRAAGRTSSTCGASRSRDGNEACILRRSRREILLRSEFVAKNRGHTFDAMRGSGRCERGVFGGHSRCWYGVWRGLEL